jgi:hypothetical protein
MHFEHPIVHFSLVSATLKSEQPAHVVDIWSFESIFEFPKLVEDMRIYTMGGGW